MVHIDNTEPWRHELQVVAQILCHIVGIWVVQPVQSAQLVRLRSEEISGNEKSIQSGRRTWPLPRYSNYVDLAMVSRYHGSHRNAAAAGHYFSLLDESYLHRGPY